MDSVKRRERGKKTYKISLTLDVINHGKSMSHLQDVARRDVQHIRKDIVNTGGRTPLYQSFMHYVWLAHSRDGFKHLNIGV